MKRTIPFFIVLALLVVKIQAQTVFDHDGNLYHTITIGTQTWTQENLKVTHFNNGDSIPKVSDDTPWINATHGAYCDYNRSSDSALTYGHLYNWLVITDSRGIAPDGWHVPSDSEWLQLINYLGGNTLAGGKLKDTGTLYWQSPNAGANNQSGFTALPGGMRGNNALFSFINANDYFWSSTVNDTTSGWCRAMTYSDSSVYKLYAKTQVGISVRLIRDSTWNVNENDPQGQLNIYPNPASEKVSVSFKGKKNLQLEIYNAVGACVFQKRLEDAGNMVDIRSLSKGVYIIQIIAADITIRQKLIKE